MEAVRWVETMDRYNRWMNERLYAVGAALSDEERKRDRGAFFRSIHGTLNHVLVGDRIWMGRFLERPFSVDSLDTELYADFEELRRERAETDREISRWVASLSEEKLAGVLRYGSFVDPQPRACPLWTAVLHFFNHQTHHRGQLTTLLVQSGADPGITDLIWMPGVQLPSGANSSP